MTGPGDARLVPYLNLKDSSLRRVTEPRDGVFIVEGRLALEAVLASPYRLVSVLVAERRVSALEGLTLPRGVPVLVAQAEVMNAVAGFDVHRGVLALASRAAASAATELLQQAPESPVVVVEGVNDQENLGAIFRNAAAFGAGAVFLSPDCTDPLYRRTVRVSLGLVLKVPFARLEPWPAALSSLAAQGFVLLALTPQPGAEPVGGVAAEVREQKVALVAGAEGPGLSPGALSRCRPVRVPMAPGVDSLNVAVAIAVALHRFSRF